jgi:hypothetical protein
MEDIMQIKFYKSFRKNLDAGTIIIRLIIPQKGIHLQQIRQISQLFTSSSSKFEIASLIVSPNWSKHNRNQECE